RPIATSTSTSIGAASIPTTAAEATRANMPPDIANAMPAPGPISRAHPAARGRPPVTPSWPRPRGLKRQAQAEARVERRLVGERLPEVRVLADRLAARGLGELQIRRRAVLDGRRGVERVVVVGDDGGLLVEDVEEVDEALEVHLGAERAAVGDLAVQLG